MTIILATPDTLHASIAANPSPIVVSLLAPSIRPEETYPVLDHLVSSHARFEVEESPARAVSRLRGAPNREIAAQILSVLLEWRQRGVYGPLIIHCTPSLRRSSAVAAAALFVRHRLCTPKFSENDFQRDLARLASGAPAFDPDPELVMSFDALFEEGGVLARAIAHARTMW